MPLNALWALSWASLHMPPARCAGIGTGSQRPFPGSSVPRLPTGYELYKGRFGTGSVMPLCQTSFPVACLSMHTAPVRLQGVVPSMLHASMSGSISGCRAEKWKNSQMQGT